jgi:hypothetical protein
MKIRIYKTPEGEVIVDTPSMKYQALGIEKCPHPGRFRSGEPFTMEVMEYDALKALAVNNEAGSAQFYYEGDVLKHDDDRSVLLMSAGEIKSKHRKRLERKLDEELAKGIPDPVAVVRLQRDKEKVKDMTDAQAYAQALVNMDEDGLAKPIIRTKLLDVK